MTRMIVHITSSAVAVATTLTLVATRPAAADWPMYGHDLANSRSAGAAGPARSQVGSLRRAWKFKSSNGDFTGTPVVAGGRLVAGTNLGSIYALDPATGKMLWSRKVGQPINGSAAIDPHAPGGGMVFVPVAKLGSPRLLALSLRTGAVRWQRVLTRQPGADVFGSPVYWRGTVYIGTSGQGNDESTARGSVLAFHEATGRLRWRTFTVPPGHDGGAVWSTPAIDTFSGRLYVGTGNAYHPPAAGTTDAMLALSASSGRILGHYQSIPGDVWEADDPTGGPDYDFGASPNLFASREGRPLVGEGQKSGTYWALDRATMRPVWHKAVGPGSQFDGGINSTGYDGTRIYGTDAIDSQVFALGRGGATQWNSLDTGTAHFSTVALGNGVVYSADSAGFLTARDAATGKVLTKIPLGHPTFGGISVVRRAVYVAIGTGPPSPAQPIPGIDTSKMDGSGSIVALRGPATSRAGSRHAGERTFSPQSESGYENSNGSRSILGANVRADGSDRSEWDMDSQGASAEPRARVLWGRAGQGDRLPGIRAPAHPLHLPRGPGRARADAQGRRCRERFRGGRGKRQPERRSSANPQIVRRLRVASGANRCPARDRTDDLWLTTFALLQRGKC